MPLLYYQWIIRRIPRKEQSPLCRMVCISLLNRPEVTDDILCTKISLGTFPWPPLPNFFRWPNSVLLIKASSFFEFFTCFFRKQAAQAYVLQRFEWYNWHVNVLDMSSCSQFESFNATLTTVHSLIHRIYSNRRPGRLFKKNELGRGGRLLERGVYQRGASISKFHITTLKIQNIHTM